MNSSSILASFQVFHLKGFTWIYRGKAKDAWELKQMGKGSLCRVVLFRNVSLNVCPTNLRLGQAYNFAQSFRNVTQPPTFGYKTWILVSYSLVFKFSICFQIWQIWVVWWTNKGQMRTNNLWGHFIFVVDNECHQQPQKRAVEDLLRIFYILKGIFKWNM